MGLNKGVMLTNYNLVANLVQSCAVISLTPADTLLCLLPLYHIYAQMMIITQVCMHCVSRSIVYHLMGCDSYSCLNRVLV
jgi:long-subunit acyl-CoA synthetase (AMP-forming)